jgi:hypothetical protein
MPKYNCHNANQVNPRQQQSINSTINHGLDRRKARGEIFSNQKTILDHIREHEYTKSKKRNSLIPDGGSILASKPPELTTYQTICDNGGRKITSYYLGGRQVNALGFGLSKSDEAWIHQNRCRGCDGFRCARQYFGSPSTAQPVKSFSSKYPVYGIPKPFPQPSPYYVAPYPASWHPEFISLDGGEIGQVCDEYIFDDSHE